MRKCRKIFALLLCLASLLTLAGCESGSDPMSPVGIWSGNTYMNYRFLLQCEIPEDWTISTEEERLALIGLTYDAVATEDLEKLFNRAGTFYDLVAASADDNQRITITVEKAAILNRMVYTAKTLLEDSVKLYISMLENSGITDIRHEVVEKEIGGRKRTCLYVSANNDGTPMFMEMFYIKSAKYYSCVNLASRITDEIPAMENFFTESGFPSGSLLPGA